MSLHFRFWHVTRAWPGVSLKLKKGSRHQYKFCRSDKGVRSTTDELRNAEDTEITIAHVHTYLLLWQNSIYGMPAFVMMKYRGTYHILADKLTKTVTLYCMNYPCNQNVCVCTLQVHLVPSRMNSCILHGLCLLGLFWLSSRSIADVYSHVCQL